MIWRRLWESKKPPLVIDEQLPIDLHARLDDIPIAMVDTETTGLDTQRDRVISFASLSMRGSEILPQKTDILIDPEMRIPKLGQKFHGIQDADVKGVGNFADKWPLMREALAGRVIGGYCIAFDIAVLHRQLRSMGILWRPEFFLDINLLMAALRPEALEAELALDAVATEYGIDLTGRHTALGDARLAAEIFKPLLEELRDSGAETLRDIYRLQFTRRYLVSMQRLEGWLEWLVES